MVANTFGQELYHMVLKQNAFTISITSIRWFGWLLMACWLDAQGNNQYKEHHTYDLTKTNSIVFNAFIFMQVCAFSHPRMLLPIWLWPGR